MKNSRQGFFFGVLLMLVLFVGAVGGALADKLFVVKPLDYVASMIAPNLVKDENLAVSLQQRVLTEESVVTDVAEKASPAVVTVSVTQQKSAVPSFMMNPFGGLFGQGFFEQQPGETKEVQQDIGSGFVVDGAKGLVVTNKHVVSDTGSKYRVVTKDDKEYEVKQIYRDPVNDLAILHIETTLPALEMGDSGNLKVGQFVIAIGTALGEFRHTVTTGVVSGLGRGISAGDGFGASAERLDNVIQTDAAINPGNSGGPLLNSAGQVIGINVAMAASGQNIGFALPINLVKDSLDNFNKTGEFNRPFLGVQYRMISKDTALMNDVPEGAYIVTVVDESPAAKAGIKQGDIITKLNGSAVKDEAGGLAAIIGKTKVGETIGAELYREGKLQTIQVTLEKSTQ